MSTRPPPVGHLVIVDVAAYTLDEWTALDLDTDVQADAPPDPDIVFSDRNPPTDETGESGG